MDQFYTPSLPRRLRGWVHRLVHDSSPSDAPPNTVSRYLRFLYLMKEGVGSVYVPTLDIDPVWHTHQLAPVAYDRYCIRYIGSAINHDDTIRGVGRSVWQDNTAQLWALKYGESYYDPANAAETAEIQRRRAIWKLQHTEVASLEAAQETVGSFGTELETYKQQFRKASDTFYGAEMRLIALSFRLQTVKSTKTSHHHHHHHHHFSHDGGGSSSHDRGGHSSVGYDGGRDSGGGCGGGGCGGCG
ncbi:hypothetical protein B0T26DRAFT_677126 [Lasiosphaeria miniovina]|uniref:Uncharacterized protein n=1 Tax=Lasiosphaeria miniovina TaxID=1954250 RepID=A0AA40DRC3_9PEZI|nr:uncharacterized protein B0T26DRAFT_677126 [Lasiosphaeria miniovina]KAK0712700.1 hypothetical protein B0T26DRAFT_677126 [Lasiosphaeria miniovina]